MSVIGTFCSRIFGRYPHSNPDGGNVADIKSVNSPHSTHRGNMADFVTSNLSVNHPYSKHRGSIADFTTNGSSVYCQKKHFGNMADLIGTSLCLLALLIVMITGVHFVKILEAKRIVNNQAREYLLILEEKGQLTPTEVTNLTNSIKSLGFADVTVTYNGTNTRALYGQQVSIYVVVNATREELGLSKVYGYIKDSYNFTCILYSTAKT